MNRLEELRIQCLTFHNEHPEVWDAFIRLTFDRINHGYKHYSVNGIFEQIRWELGSVGGDGEEQFKLNNNYRPFYARAFMQNYPEHDGFFRIREQISKNTSATFLPELQP